MKKLFTFFLIALIASICLETAASPVKRFIRFEERISDNRSESFSIGVPEKSLRTSTSRGDIHLIFDDAVPDSTRTAFNYAKEMWEAQLPIEYPVYIQVFYEAIEDDVAMVVDVSYFEDFGNDGCPSSLYNQRESHSNLYDNSPDGMIWINPNASWNCSFIPSNNGFNAPTMALKALAICFGFGSSIYEYEGEFMLFADCYTYFDKLLCCSKYRLVEIEPGCEEFSDFVQSNDVSIDIEENSYKVYAPAIYEPYRSLVYLQEPNSLMDVLAGHDNTFLDIDSATKNILHEIGWEIKSYDFEVECEDINSDGLGSAYSAHTFYLSGGNVNIDEYNWTFYLKRIDGEYSLIENGNESSFTIEKIENNGDYYINLNGDLEGRIECSFISNGNSYNTKPFDISLEQKPIIKKIYNLVANPIDNYYFNLQFDVEYLGAQRIMVENEEEYSSKIGVRYINEPFIAHVNIPKLRSINYNWITVTVKNNYGEVYDVIEISPDFINSQHDTSSIPLTNQYTTSGTTETAIYSLDGRLIIETTNDSFDQSILSPGIYIMRKTTSEFSSSKKLIIR